MKKVLILLLVLGALIGVAYIAQENSAKRLKPAAGREKLIPDLDINSVRKIRIKEEDKTTTLAFAGENWTVVERGGYPAAFEKIGNLLVELKDQKAGKPKTYGQGAWDEVKLKAPGEGGKDETGLQLELLGDGDKPIANLIIGSNVTSNTVGKEASPFGGGGNERYVRLTSDKDVVWVVENQFYELKPAPEDWVDKSFVDVQKIKEVQVTAPKAEDSWKASRKDDTSEFALVDPKAGEEFDNSKATLSSLLSSATFNDVVPKEKATADFMKDAYTVKISTFEGFNYDIKMLKKGEGSDEKHYMSVAAVSADLQKERPPVKDEKPEDKKKADDDFAAKKKTLEEKLANEKKFEGFVFDVSSYVVSNALKKRSEVLKEKAADAPPAAPATSSSAPATPPSPPPAAPAPPPPAPQAPATPPAAAATPEAPPAAPASAPAPAAPPMPNPAPPASPTPPASDATKPPSVSVSTPPIAVPTAPAPQETPAKSAEPAATSSQETKK